MKKKLYYNADLKQLFVEHARYRKALQRIATDYPINDEPLATAHSLRAHKALRPDCKCGRCAPIRTISFQDAKDLDCNGGDLARMGYILETKKA